MKHDIEPVVIDRLAQCDSLRQFRFFTVDGLMVEVFGDAGLYRVTLFNQKQQEDKN